MTTQILDALENFVNETVTALDEIGENQGLALTEFHQAAKELRSAINEEPRN